MAARDDVRVVCAHLTDPGDAANLATDAANAIKSILLSLSTAQSEDFRKKAAGFGFDMAALAQELRASGKPMTPGQGARLCIALDFLAKAIQDDTSGAMSEKAQAFLNSLGNLAVIATERRAQKRRGFPWLALLGAAAVLAGGVWWYRRPHAQRQRPIGPAGGHHRRPFALPWQG